MNHPTFQSLVESVPFGKLLPEAKYLHFDGWEELPPELCQFLKEAFGNLRVHPSWNVLKLSRHHFKVSLLNYPDFFNEPFPALRESLTVSFPSLETRLYDFSTSANPPILHRKELLLPSRHPQREEFAGLTRKAEEAGLFFDTPRIGQKQFWDAWLAHHGWEVRDGDLHRIQVGNVGARGVAVGSAIHRHRTALNRNQLSLPMQKLQQFGLLNKEASVFDFGCGRGDDVRALQAQGIKAMGWDPHFFPGEAKGEADVVNLGYVINVIEDPQERRTCLQEAFALTRKVLAVSAMLHNANSTTHFRAFGDGHLTSWGTFQKYYSQGELRDFLESTLEVNAVAVTPGLFFVFRDSADEQMFLATRQTRVREYSPWDRRLAPRPKREPRRSLGQFIWPNWSLVEQFKESCLAVGRIPGEEEFPQLRKIEGGFGSLNKAWSFVREHWGPEDFETAGARRREDLVVHFALAHFARRRPFSELPPRLRWDVKAFFGSLNKAQQAGRELLFSIGNLQAIRDGCVQAGIAGIGWMIENHALLLHSSLVKDLPPILRCYVGCAAQIFGDLETADVVKIHLRSQKISLMMYEGFFDSPLPRLHERIKVRLGDLDFDYFDYRRQPKTQVLFFKGRLLPSNHPTYESQVAFDRALAEIPNLDLSGYGPSEDNLSYHLAALGLMVDGFSLRPRGVPPSPSAPI